MDLEPKQQPAVESSLGVYFRDRLSDCAQHMTPPPQEDTCWYLSRLLERFGRSEDFFGYEDGRLALRPLALLYGDAWEARTDHERCLLLQQLGDMALFTGALFPERFTQRGIQQDYIVGMGGGAYDYLASNARSGRHIFAELASTFTVMIELVASACCAEQNLDSETILGLYETWLATQSPLIAKQLKALGIDPVAGDAVH